MHFFIYVFIEFMYLIYVFIIFEFKFMYLLNVVCSI